MSEKFFEMVAALGADNVGMVTGDAAVNSDAPVIVCTARFSPTDPCARATTPMSTSS